MAGIRLLLLLMVYSSTNSSTDIKSNTNSLLQHTVELVQTKKIIIPSDITTNSYTFRSQKILDKLREATKAVKEIQGVSPQGDKATFLRNLFESILSRISQSFDDCVRISDQLVQKLYDDIRPPMELDFSTEAIRAAFPRPANSHSKKLVASFPEAYLVSMRDIKNDLIRKFYLTIRDPNAPDFPEVTRQRVAILTSDNMYKVLRICKDTGLKPNPGAPPLIFSPGISLDSLRLVLQDYFNPTAQDNTAPCLSAIIIGLQNLQRGLQNIFEPAGKSSLRDSDAGQIQPLASILRKRHLMNKRSAGFFQNPVASIFGLATSNEESQNEQHIKYIQEELKNLATNRQTSLDHLQELADLEARQGADLQQLHGQIDSIVEQTIRDNKASTTNIRKIASSLNKTANLIKVLFAIDSIREDVILLSKYISRDKEVINSLLSKKQMPVGLLPTPPLPILGGVNVTFSKTNMKLTFNSISSYTTFRHFRIRTLPIPFKGGYFFMDFPKDLITNGVSVIPMDELSLCDPSIFGTVCPSVVRLQTIPPCLKAVLQLSQGLESDSSSCNDYLTPLEKGKKIQRYIRKQDGINLFSSAPSNGTLQCGTRRKVIEIPPGLSSIKLNRNCNFKTDLIFVQDQGIVVSNKPLNGFQALNYTTNRLLSSISQELEVPILEADLQDLPTFAVPSVELKEKLSDLEILRKIADAKETSFFSPISFSDGSHNTEALTFWVIIALLSVSIIVLAFKKLLYKLCCIPIKCIKKCKKKKTPIYKPDSRDNDTPILENTPQILNAAPLRRQRPISASSMTTAMREQVARFMRSVYTPNPPRRSSGIWAGSQESEANVNVFELAASLEEPSPSYEEAITIDNAAKAAQRRLRNLKTEAAGM